jgi:hypothetical protein
MESNRSMTVPERLGSEGIPDSIDRCTCVLHPRRSHRAAWDLDDAPFRRHGFWAPSNRDALIGANVVRLSLVIASQEGPKGALLFC